MAGRWRIAADDCCFVNLNAVKVGLKFCWYSFLLSASNNSVICWIILSLIMRFQLGNYLMRKTRFKDWNWFLCLHGFDRDVGEDSVQRLKLFLCLHGFDWVVGEGRFIHIISIIGIVIDTLSLCHTCRSCSRFNLRNSSKVATVLTVKWIQTASSEIPGLFMR